VLFVRVVATRGRVRRMLALVVVASTILAAKAVKSYLAGEFTLVRLMRVEGPPGIFQNPNDLAAMLVVAIPLAVALAAEERGGRRVLYSVCAVLMVGGVLATMSRGGMLGLTVAGGVLMWKLGRRHRRAVVAAGCLAVASLAATSPNAVTERLYTIVAPAQDRYGTAQERMVLLEQGIDLAAHNPVVGIGMGNFHLYAVRNLRAHNSFLEISAELGVAGLAAFLVLLGAPVVALARIERETAAGEPAREAWDPATREVYYLSVGVQASIVGYAVCCFFLSVQYVWDVHYAVAFAVALRSVHRGIR
jgi:O-antigen ligase